MVQEKYGVRLTGQERGRLRRMIRAGKSSAQAITRARILLKTDEGWTASRVAGALDLSERTVRRAKRRYVEEGLEEVLRHHNSPNPYRKVDDKVEAHLIALACSPAPEGQDHWTLRALAGKAVELGLVESLSVNGGEIPGHRPQVFQQRRGRWVEGGEDKPLVAVELGHRNEAPLGLVQLVVVGVLEVRNRLQLAVGAEGPAVIGADEGGGVAVLGAA